MSTLRALVVSLAALLSCAADPVDDDPLGEPTRKPKLTGTAVAAKRAQDIATTEQRLATLKAQRNAMAEDVAEFRVWGARELPARLQEALDANALAIVELEALLTRLRGSPKVPPTP